MSLLCSVPVTGTRRRVVRNGPTDLMRNMRGEIQLQETKHTRGLGTSTICALLGNSVTAGVPDEVWYVGAKCA